MGLMEQPLLILGGGGLVLVLLIVGLVQTGRYSFLYAAIAVSLMTICGLVVERFVVTPLEEVRATLHVIARDLEANDVDAVLGHISEGRPALREEAKSKMGFVELLDVDIKRNLSVEVVARPDMEVAEAKFNATFRFRVLRGSMAGETRPYPQHVMVRFRRESGKWRIRDYALSDPRAGIGN